MKYLLAALLVVFPLSASAVMTTSDNIDTFTGSAATSFELNFTVNDCSEIWVTIEDDSAGTTTTLICNGLDRTGVDFDRFLLDTAGDGTTTLTIPVAVDAADTLTAMRVIRFRQPVPYRNQYRFSGLKLERSFDDLTEMALQVSTQLDIGTKTVTAHEAESDPHPDLFLLAGRSGGQTLRGGTQPQDSLNMFTTSNSTKGKLFMGDMTYDDVNVRFGVGTTTPDKTLDLEGSAKSLEIDGNLFASSLCVWSDCGADDGQVSLESGVYMEATSDGDPFFSWESSGLSAWSFSREDISFSLALNGSVVFTADDSRLNVVQALTVGVDSPTYEVEIDGEAIIDTEFQVAGFNDSDQSEASASMFLGDTSGDDSIFVLTSNTSTTDILDNPYTTFGAVNTVTSRIALYENLGGCARSLYCGAIVMYASGGYELQNGDLIAIGTDGNAAGAGGAVADGPRVRGPIVEGDDSNLEDIAAACSDTVVAKNGSNIFLPSADSGTDACVVHVVYDGNALGYVEIEPESDDTVYGTVVRDETAAADIVEVISDVSEVGQPVSVGYATGTWYTFISDGSNSWYAYGVGGAGNFIWIPPGNVVFPN